MEDVAQTNMFAEICTVFTLLIIGCAIQYPKTGNLHYMVIAKKNIHKYMGMHNTNGDSNSMWY